MARRKRISKSVAKLSTLAELEESKLRACLGRVVAGATEALAGEGRVSLANMNAMHEATRSATHCAGRLHGFRVAIAALSELDEPVVAGVTISAKDAASGVSGRAGDDDDLGEVR